LRDPTLVSFFGQKICRFGKEVKSQMELLKRLCVEEDGQGLVEYTLIVVLVALVFWVAIKNTNVGNQLASGWSKVTSCVGDPSACDVSS
jgi:Flp pilus assembly pilin Flp